MPDSEPQPRQQKPENPAPPERRERETKFSAETARIILSVTSRELVHPDNKLTDAHRQKFKSEISGKTSKDLPSAEIADLSRESRLEDHDSYDNWSEKVKKWYNAKDNTTKEAIKNTFTRLGITVNDRMEQAQVDEFFDRYLDMSGSEKHYQDTYDAFVKNVVDEFIDEDGKLKREALNNRMDVLKPLLVSFGQKDIVALVDAHIKAHGYVSQEVEAKNTQADEALKGADTTMTDAASIKGFKKLAAKLHASQTQPSHPPAPEQRPPSTPLDHSPTGPPAPPEHPSGTPEGKGEDDDEEEHTYEEIAGGKSVQIETGDHIRQDRMLFAPEDHAFGVFDGVSSETDSEKGAQICRDYLHEVVQHMPNNLSLPDTIDYLQKEIILLNQIVQMEPVGSATLTFSYVWTGLAGERTLINFNSGDTRLYGLKNSNLVQLSLDTQPEVVGRTEEEQFALQETLARVDTVADYEALSERDKARFQNRNIVSQAIGKNKLSAMNPLLTVVELQDGEEFVLTSDGIHDNLTDAQIKTFLENASDPAAAAQELIKQSRLRAAARDGIRSKPDDMTVIVLAHLDKLPARGPAKPADTSEDPHGVYAKYKPLREQTNQRLQQAENALGRKLTAMEKTYVMFTGDTETVDHVAADELFARTKRARDNRLTKERYARVTSRLQELAQEQHGTAKQEYKDLLLELHNARLILQSEEEIRVFGILYGLPQETIIQYIDAYKKEDKNKQPNTKAIINILFRQNKQDVTLPYTQAQTVPVSGNGNTPA